MKKQIGSIILTFGTVLVIYLAISNGAAVPLSLFGAHVFAPEGAAIFGSYALGVLCTFALLASRFQASARSDKTVTEWQAQDDKLAKQVQSDREKQLEAKVATLEAALQRALKKS